MAFQGGESVHGPSGSGELLLQVVDPPGWRSLLRVQDGLHQSAHLGIGGLEGGVWGKGFAQRNTAHFLKERGGDFSENWWELGLRFGFGKVRHSVMLLGVAPLGGENWDATKCDGWVSTGLQVAAGE